MGKRLKDYQMPGLPGTTHQRVAGWLYAEIAVYLRARRENCQAIAAPFAVFLDGEEADCVQPDISVVSDVSLLDEAGCHGAPDWVVEVVNSSSRSVDYGGKLAAYIEAGVKEYWTVDPDRSVIVCFFLEDPDVPAVYHFGDIVRSGLYEDFMIDSTPLKAFRYEAAESASADNGRESEEPQSGDMTRSGAVPESGAVGGQDGARIEGEDPEWKAGGQEEPSSGRGQEIRESMSVDEVKAYLEEHFAEMISSRNKGQLMKAALAALKGKADAKIISEAAGQLCRQEI